MSYSDLPQRLLGSKPRVRQPAPYALLRVQGPDAKDFLQRLCSQDVLGMADGEVRPAAFLNGKGRLLAVCHLAVAGETVWLSAQSDIAGSLGEMLERFHFTEKLEVAAVDGECGEVFSLVQDGGAEDDGANEAGAKILEVTGADFAFTAARGGVRWSRVHAAAAFFAADGWNPDGYEPLEAGAADALRIATNEMWVGRDSEENTLGLELPIHDHISTTKGCYTGQEIVARIHTYGHTNRALCRLGIAGTGAIESGAMLVELDDGDPVGRVMTAADLPGEDRRVAFGFLPTALTEAGTKLALGDGDGPEVEVLP